MKNKILTFIIGILIGAIITTSGFLIYNKKMNKNMNPNKRMPMNKDGSFQFPDGVMRELPEGMPSEFESKMPRE